ncbi:4Fe-4S single cluster protein [Yoonia maricola]|uniref:4Fe-4S single cluster protein n=1 Tax=Yoonia maricola TaxID=420999 RepID=A0A2M8WPT3_9RHOB|nr:radical SAM protein [Yoonia maricola]PJI92914.1 4Fe-4S single cluster protein [Yoonia maricola]
MSEIVENSKKGEIPISAAELKITYKCNMGCRFCWVGDRRSVKNMNLSEQIENLRYLSKHAKQKEIHISGGEPTTREELYEISKAAHALFDRVILHSNVMAFADDYYAARHAKYFTHVIASLQAATPESHVYITRLKDKLDTQLVGIQNLIGHNVQVGVNTVMSRPIVPELPLFPDILAGLGVRFWLMTFPFMHGWAAQKQEELIPQSFEELIPSMEKAMDCAAALDLPVVLNGVPACYLSERTLQILNGLKRAHELGFGGYGAERIMVDSKEQFLSGNAFAYDTIHVRHSECCKDCVLMKGPCTGFWPDLVTKDAWPDLHPII